MVKYKFAIGLNGEKIEMSIKKAKRLLKQGIADGKPCALHEYFDMSNTLVKPFWDIDLYDPEKLNDEILETTVLPFLADLISKVSGIDENQILESFAVSKDHRFDYTKNKDKVSFHLTLPNFKTNGRWLKAFVKQNFTELQQWGFDTSVYRNGLSKYRCLWATKDIGKTHYFEPIVGEFKDFLLQEIVDEDIMLFENYEEKVKKKVSYSSSKENKIEKPNEADECVNFIFDNHTVLKKYEEINLDRYLIDEPCKNESNHENSRTHRHLTYYKKCGVVWFGCSDNACKNMGSKVFEKKKDPSSLVEVDDESLAWLVCEFLKNVIVCVNECDKNFYVWDEKEKLWYFDKKGKVAKNTISCFLKDYFHNQGMTDKKILQLFGSNMKLSGVLELVCGKMKSNKEFLKKLNADRHLLSVKNGVIDLRTGELRQRRRKDNLSYALDIVYEKKVLPENSVLNSFLTETFKGKENIIQWLQRYLGCCLSGEVEDQLFVFFHGAKGGNGKGLIISLMADILGNRFTDLPSNDLCVGNRAREEKRMFGKLQHILMAVVDEFDRKSRLKIGLCKKLSGLQNSTVVECKKLYLDLFDSPMFFKILVSTNVLPAFEEDDAWFRRCLIVPFDRYFRFETDNDYDPNDVNCGLRDRDLPTKIKNEGLFFQWVVEGAVKYYKNPLCNDIPHEILNYTLQQRQENDVVGCFLENFTEPTENRSDFVSLGELFELFFAETNSRLGKIVFGKMLKSKGYTNIVKKNEFGKMCRCWKNLKLK
tara:strand:+ start:294 stop:2579 length:2286 start_codon:yes stop_codon:yes gene_type:complete